jgi:uncharacterized surface protein with fasciclin (FAS1) repeats
MVGTPYQGTPHVTYKRFGYRAPFSYGYPPAHRAAAPTTAPQAKVPTPAPAEQPARDQQAVEQPAVEPGDAAADSSAIAPKQSESPEADDEATAAKTSESSETMKEQPKTPPAEAEPAELLGIIETAEKADNLSNVIALAKKAKLDGELVGGKFTVFVPTDAAFDKLDDKLVKRLEEDWEYLREVLRHHAVDGEYSAEKLVEMKSVKPFSGAKLQITQTAEGVFVDGVRVETADVQCSNGTVHILRGVLIPTEPDTSDAAPKE